MATATAAALLLVLPVAASAAPGSGLPTPGSADSGSGDSGSSDSGSSDSGSGGSGSAGTEPDIDPNNYAQECPDVLMLAVSGATDADADRDPLDEQERSPISNWVGNVTLPTGQANSANPGSVGWLYVPYPSTYGVDIFSVPSYQDSTLEGVASTNRLLDEYKIKCGDGTKFVLLGYSVGGEVVERVSMELGHRDPNALVTGDDIAGVVMIGAPYRPAGVPNFDEPGPSRGGFQSSTPKDYGTLNDKVTWSCRPYDLACDAPDDIVALQLALGVLGQMRFTLLNPVQTISDFAQTVTSIATRAIVDIATNKNWLESNETLLEVLLKVSDKAYDVDVQTGMAQLTPEQLLADLNWAMGPGAETVHRKLRAEGEGLIENNKGIVDVVVEPYIFIGFLQHLLYWNNNPGDSRAWESEKIVAWISELAQEERERKDTIDAPLAPSEADPAPVEDVAPLPEAAREPDPQTLPTPGTLTRESDLGAFLESLGLVRPGVFEPRYESVPAPVEAPSTDIVPEISQR